MPYKAGNLQRYSGCVLHCINTTGKNVRVEAGPLTLIEGWLPVEAGKLEDDVINWQMIFWE